MSTYVREECGIDVSHLIIMLSFLRTSPPVAQSVVSTTDVSLERLPDHLNDVDKLATVYAPFRLVSGAVHDKESPLHNSGPNKVGWGVQGATGTPGLAAAEVWLCSCHSLKYARP